MNSSHLNVLHINFADNSGGAARSAYKIHTGIRNKGSSSKMLVRYRATDDPDVDFIHSRNLLTRMGDLLGKKIVDKIGFPYLYNPSSFALLNHPWFKAADVIQIYNLHAITCFFTYRALPKISHLKPVVWRLSDMWPLTGHCVYSYECDRWKTGCGSCPYLKEYPALNIDTTALLWKLKKRVYQRSKLVIVSTNSWMENLVSNSPLLSQFPIHRIPNGIDTTRFYPMSKVLAREKVKFPTSGNIVLFAAYDLTENRKGGQYIPQVMEKITAQGVKDVTLVVMGKGSQSWQDSPNYSTLKLPFTDDDQYLSMVYAAADLVLHPAIVENMPNSILESMACGTPCIAFDTGGVKDIVHHLQTGYLAQYKNVEDMAQGVQLLLENDDLRLSLRQKALSLVQNYYTLEHQTQGHLALYDSLIKSWHNSEFQ